MGYDSNNAKKSNTEEKIRLLNKKDYPLKSLLPLGFFVLDLCRYRCDTRYDRWLTDRLVFLYDRNSAAFYLRAHWANKLVHALLGLVLAAFLGIAAGEPDLYLFAFAFLFSAGMFCLPDYELERRIKKRQFLIRLEFPDFLNKLLLLLNGGMTVPRAWEKVARNGRDTPLYEELRRTALAIQAGQPVLSSYEEFARRCRTPEVSRFVAALLQNLRKGSAELVSVLIMQADECWQMRKDTARKLGEEASTKLLLPMMLMFLAILLIVAAPAVISLRGLN